MSQRPNENPELHPLQKRQILEVLSAFSYQATASAVDTYLLYQQQRQLNQKLEAEVAKRTEELRIAQEHWVERERLATLGEFVAMIVHEIRNPVTTIRLGLDHLKRISLTELDQIRANLSIEEVNRLERLLEELLRYAKPLTLQLAELEINEWLSKTLLLLREMPEATDRVIDLNQSDTNPVILGDQDKLKQLFTNLIRNACEAIAPQETVACQILSVDDSTDDSAYVVIRMHNGGAPIPPDQLPHLGKLFYSTKPGGTGLGLAIVKQIVEAHHGRFSVQSGAAGTTIEVQLPRIASSGSRFG